MTQLMSIWPPSRFLGILAEIRSSIVVKCICTQGNREARNSCFIYMYICGYDVSYVYV